MPTTTPVSQLRKSIKSSLTKLASLEAMLAKHSYAHLTVLYARYAHYGTFVPDLIPHHPLVAHVAAPYAHGYYGYPYAGHFGHYGYPYFG